MAAALEAAMAVDLNLPDGYVVVWAAIDPTSGADVSGVVVSNVSIFGTALGSGLSSGTEIAGPYMLVPGPAA
jgi:hypothetical protein